MKKILVHLLLSFALPTKKISLLTTRSFNARSIYIVEEEKRLLNVFNMYIRLADYVCIIRKNRLDQMGTIKISIDIVV